jgi:hypothetical protein
MAVSQLMARLSTRGSPSLRSTANSVQPREVSRLLKAAGAGRAVSWTGGLRSRREQVRARRGDPASTA